MAALRETLVEQLADHRAGWSVGSFGTIAEFHHDAGEETIVAEPLARATARGAIRIERTDGATPIAWEALSKDPARWQQGVAICLPSDEAKSARRACLTELGPDHAAVREADRDAILFDMGLEQENVDFCIRTSDPALLENLRAAEGRPLAEPGNPAMGAILKAHPHRVAISALGRCEVYQMIGGADTGGVSPEGPHTHVLPDLMAAGRTHSANTPIPEGLTPALNLYPGNPVMTPLGGDREFDADLFTGFQALIERWGPDGYMETKRRVWAALDAEAAPEDEAAAATRVHRTARRNAIRQRARIAGVSEALAAWSAAHDRGAHDADADMPGHQERS